MADVQDIASGNGLPPSAEPPEVREAHRFFRADVMMDQPWDQLREGDRFTSRARTVTEFDVVQFASITGDWHPSHTNKVWAEEHGVVGERVAHEMLLLSYAIGLVPNTYVVALRRLIEVAYETPVRLGDTIHVEGRVNRLRPFSDELGMVNGLWWLMNQHGETCLTMEFEMLWQLSWDVPKPPQAA
jgi:3-hydroxybutyryl-CoA dehydratase